MRISCPKCKTECSSRLDVCPICGIVFSEWNEKERKNKENENENEKKIFLDQNSTINVIADVIHTFKKGTTHIHSYALKDDALKIKKIIIPKSVEEIEKDAFWFCKNLEDIEFEGDDISFDEDAFNGLEKLYKIKVVDSLISSVLSCKGIADCIKTIDIDYLANESIERIRFSEFVNLESVVIEEGFEEIENNAFENCVNLKNITLPNSLRKIGDYSFKNCAKMKEIIIPCGVIDIGRNIFENCNLDMVEAPVTITFGNEYLISSKTKLTFNKTHITLDEDDYYRLPHCNCKRLVIPEGIVNIDAGAFRKVDCLEEVVFPSTLESVEYCAFEHCRNLKKINIPNNLFHISSFAFLDCGIDELIIPPSVEEIGDMAFAENPIKKIVINNKDISIGDSVFNWDTLEVIKMPMIKNTYFYRMFNFRGYGIVTSRSRPSEVSNDKKGESIFDKKIIITGDDEIILKEQFLYFGNCIREIDGIHLDVIDKQESIDDSYGVTIIIECPIKKIEERAFEGCYFVKSITLPITLNVIGNSAFERCKSLSKIDFPDNLEVIGKESFKSSGLKKIVLPRFIKRIDYGAFDYDVVIVIPEDIQSVKDLKIDYNKNKIIYRGNIRQWKKLVGKDKGKIKNNNIYYEK